jgi:hypothetical protein
MHTVQTLSSCSHVAVILAFGKYLFGRCHDISLLRGWLVAGLPLACIKGGALGYKSMGRSHLYDSRTIINTINYPHVQVLYL